MSPRFSRRALLAAFAATGCRKNVAADPSQAFWFGGDVHLGASSPRLGLRLRGLLNGLGVVNLEGLVGPAPHARIDEEKGRVTLTSTASAVVGLPALGIGAVTAANNHRLDVARIDDTVRALSKTRVVEQGTTSLGATGQGATRIAAFDLPSAKEVSTEVLRAFEGGENRPTIAAFHVTGPPSYIPQQSLKKAVDAAVAGGARVVVAHGTHGWGPVERRRGPHGDVVIAWGLGNLFFSCACTASKEGLILRTVVRGERIDASVIPVDAGLWGEPATVAAELDLCFEVLGAIGSSSIRRDGVVGVLRGTRPGADAIIKP